MQVLGELFDSLHRAECGNLHAGALDPLLPHIVRVPIAMANGQAVAAPSSAQSNAMSLARRLFGLEVQVVLIQAVPLMRTSVMQVVVLVNRCSLPLKPLCLPKLPCAWTLARVVLAFCLIVERHGPRLVSSCNNDLCVECVCVYLHLSTSGW